MNAPIPNLIGPAIAEVYTPFREAMETYQALVTAGEADLAQTVYLTAQTIAAAFYAGVEFGRGGK